MSVGRNELNPEELVQTHQLPDDEWTEYFTRIYVEEEIKDKLVNYGLLLETFDDVGLDQMTLGYHGAVLLYGPPGTGKTSLAKGVGNQVAQRLDEKVVFRQVDVEQMFSGRLGDTPKAVSAVFDLVVESAETGTKQVVLLDEVESLISDRGGLVGETDPMDVARAVNVALEKLDELADYSNIYLIATSNLPSAVDSAFFDRADVHFRIGNPDATNRERILIDIFDNLNETFGTALPTEGPVFEDLVDLSAGFSGRRIRKVVLESLAAKRETIVDPTQLDRDQLRTTFERTKERLISQGADDTVETELFTTSEREDTGSGPTGSQDGKSGAEVPAQQKDNSGPGDPTSGRSVGDNPSAQQSATGGSGGGEQSGQISNRGKASSPPRQEKGTSGGADSDALESSFERTVVFDETEQRPAEALLERTAILFDDILNQAGHDAEVKELLLSDPVTSGTFNALAQDALRRVVLQVGDQRGIVDVEKEIGGGAEISAPLEDVMRQFPPNGPIRIEFILTSSIPTLEQVAESTTENAPAEIAVEVSDNT